MNKSIAEVFLKSFTLLEDDYNLNSLVMSDYEQLVSMMDCPSFFTYSEALLKQVAI